MSEEMIEKAWAAFVNCADDRYFGNRTKREKELKVLRELVDETERAALSAYNPNERLREALEGMPDEIEVWRIMQRTGGKRIDMARAVADRIKGICNSALSPLPQGEDT